MAFPTSDIITTQVMVTIFWFQFFALCNRTDYLKKLFNIFPLLFPVSNPV